MKTSHPQTAYEQALQASAQTGGPAWLQTARRDSQSRLAEVGLPTRTSEAYKYMNLRGLLDQPYATHGPTLDFAVDATMVNAHLLAESAQNRVVFVNGVFCESLSSLKQGPLTVTRLSNALTETSLEDVFKTWLAMPESDPFALVNATQFEDGAFVKADAEAGPSEKTMVQVVFLTTGEADARFATYPRSLFVVEAGAKLHLLLQFVGHHAGSYFTNAMQQFVVREGGELTCEVVQNEAPDAWHFANSRALVEQKAKFSLTTLTFGGKNVRHAVEIKLDGEQAECHLDGLNVLDGDSEAFHYTVIDHAKPNGVSRQYYKGILDDCSKSSFNGTIVVRKDAQQTDSEQLNKNLMLSDDAKAYTRPQLQISADDVKCAHGATVGQLDEDQMFYLASRGIDATLARGILTYGFAEEIIQRLPYDSLRVYLDRCLFNVLHEDGGRSLERCAVQKHLKS